MTNINKDEIRETIGEYFDYPLDFDFVDLVERLFTRLGSLKEVEVITETEEIANTYYSDQWIIARYYRLSPKEVIWEQIMEEFQNDMLSIAKELKTKYCTKEALLDEFMEELQENLDIDEKEGLNPEVSINYVIKRLIEIKKTK